MSRGDAEAAAASVEDASLGVIANGAAGGGDDLQGLRQRLLQAHAQREREQRALAERQEQQRRQEEEAARKARRREAHIKAQRRWRDNQKLGVADLEKQVQQRHELVAALANEQAALRAKERALAKALAGTNMQLQGIDAHAGAAAADGGLAPPPRSSLPGGGSSCASGGATEPHSASPGPDATPPLAAASALSTDAGRVQGSAPRPAQPPGPAPAPAAAPSPVLGPAPGPTLGPAQAPALGLLGASSMQLHADAQANAQANTRLDVWGCKDLKVAAESGDPTYDWVVKRVAQLGKMEPAPPDVIDAIRLKYLELTNVLDRAFNGALPTAEDFRLVMLDPATKALFVDTNLYLRKAIFIHPFLRHQLRYVNLVTGAHEVPPDGFWQRISEQSGAVELLDSHQEAALELKAQGALTAARMAKLKDEQASLQRELDRLLTEPADSMAANPGIVDRQDLVQSLEAVLFAQLSLQNVLLQGARNLFPADMICRMIMLAKPFWPDWVSMMTTWAEC